MAWERHHSGGCSLLADHFCGAKPCIGHPKYNQLQLRTNPHDERTIAAVGHGDCRRHRLRASRCWTVSGCVSVNTNRMMNAFCSCSLENLDICVSTTKTIPEIWPIAKTACLHIRLGGRFGEIPILHSIDCDVQRWSLVHAFPESELA